MKDLIGQRFGKLTVIANDPDKHEYVIVRCDCGTERSVRRWNLTTNRRPARSCGCESKKRCVENAQSHNAKNRAYYTNLEVIKTDKPYINNKSGHKGVYWDKHRNKWCASICVHRKTTFIGRFDKLEDAIEARQEAVEKLHDPLIRMIEENEREKDTNVKAKR